MLLLECRFSQVPVPKLRHGVAPIRSYNGGNTEQSYRGPLVSRRPLYIGDIEVSYLRCKNIFEHIG